MANTKAIVAIFLVIVITATVISFFIGKGVAGEKTEYYLQLADYGYEHCVMYDQTTDSNFHDIMNRIVGSLEGPLSIST